MARYYTLPEKAFIVTHVNTATVGRLILLNFQFGIFFNRDFIFFHHDTKYFELSTNLSIFLNKPIKSNVYGILLTKAMLLHFAFVRYYLSFTF